MASKTKAPIDIETADTDAASAYDAWFRTEAEAGLREADDPNTLWVTNEEVEQQSADRRAKWQAEIERRRKSA